MCPHDPSNGRMTKLCNSIAGYPLPNSMRARSERTIQFAHKSIAIVVFCHFSLIANDFLRSDYEFVANYKLLQAAFDKNHVQRFVDVPKLIRAKYQGEWVLVYTWDVLRNLFETSLQLVGALTGLVSITAYYYSSRQP